MPTDRGETGEAGPQRVRLDSLTSLRWFAASAVFIRHAGITWGLGSQGPSGVSFFFILSGFVLAWSASSSGPLPAGRFYKNRFARIYPAHVVGLIFSAVCFTFIVGNAFDWGPSLFTLTVLQAWIPSHRWYMGGNGVSWSLADEAFFYAVFPFVFRRITQLVDGVILRILGALVVIGIAVPLVVRASESDEFWFWFTYANPAVRIVEFLIGVCAATLVHRTAFPKVPFLPAVALAVVAYVAAGQMPFHTQYVATTLVPFTLLIVAAAQSDLAGATSRVLGSKLLITLGKWSFAFYLVHQTVLASSRHVDVLRSHYFVRVAVAYPVAALLAGLMFKAVEEPMERRIRAFRR